MNPTAPISTLSVMTPEVTPCLRCRHFQVTWEPDHPRACRAYGFKSRDYPSVVVERESGQPCALSDSAPSDKRTEGSRRDDGRLS